MEKSYFYDMYENVKIYFYNSIIEDDSLDNFCDLIDVILDLDTLNHILKKENKIVNMYICGADCDCDILHKIFDDKDNVSYIYFFLDESNKFYLYKPFGKSVFISDLRCEI